MIHTQRWATALAVTLAATRAAAGETSEVSSQITTGSALGGAGGYGRVVGSQMSEPGRVRVGVRGGGFQSGAFPVEGTNRLLAGDLNGAFVLRPGLELYGAYRNSSNSHSKSIPSLVQATGDLTLGGRYLMSRGPFRFGGDVRADLRSGVGSNLWSTDASALHLRGVGGYSLPIQGRLLHLDVNLGFVLGASETAFDPRMTPALLFGTGLSGYHQLQTAVGAQYEFGRFTPFASLALDTPLGIDSVDAANASTSTLGAASKRFTLGSRVGFDRFGALDVFAEFAGGSAVRGWAATQPWMLFVSYALALDPVAAVSGSARAPAPSATVPPLEPITPPVQVATTGQVSGTVTDAASSSPLSGVLVTVRGAPRPPVATGEDGRFLTYELGTGTVTVELSKDGYENASAQVAVTAGTLATADIRLQKKPAPPKAPEAPPAPPKPQLGWIAGHAESPAGKLGGVVRLEGATKLEATIDETGLFSVRAPPGTYDLVVLPQGHVAVRTKVEVKADELAAPSFKLAPKPAKPSITVADGIVTPVVALRLDEKVATPAPTEKNTLLDLADLLIRDGSQRLAVVVHSDAPAKPGDDRKAWTEARAQGLRDALIALGVDASHVEARGMGLEQPLVPSASPKRAKNRRVELLLTTAAPAPAPAAPPADTTGGGSTPPNDFAFPDEF